MDILTSFGCWPPVDPDRTWQKRDFPNPHRFPDGAISFPVKLQKIPCSDAQGISEYRIEIAELFDAFAWARNAQRAKFPVFSQLAGNLGESGEGWVGSDLATPGLNGREAVAPMGIRAMRVAGHGRRRLIGSAVCR